MKNSELIYGDLLAIANRMGTLFKAVISELL